jgi:AAA domain
VSAVCPECGTPSDEDEFDGLCPPCSSRLDAEQDAEERREHREWGRRKLRARAVSTVRVEPTRWVWRDRIALGALTLVVGREGAGKSTLTALLAALLSVGELDGDLHGCPAATLLLSLEDSASRTIVPRLKAVGADLERVHLLDAEREGHPDLVTLPSDAHLLAEQVRETGARLLVIDPLSAALAGDVDSHRDASVRRALAPIVQLAQDVDLAVVLVSHWSKARDGDALSRVLGSRGLTAAVRGVLAFGRPADAEDSSPERILAHAKSNLGPLAPSLACRLDSAFLTVDGELLSTSKLTLGGECDATADSLLATRTDDDRSDRDQAADWLSDELADGAWHEAQGLIESAGAAGHARRTVYRARDALGVESKRFGASGVGARARTSWRIPVVPTHSSPVGTTGGGTTAETRTVEPNGGGSLPPLCQSSDTGTTGAEPTENGRLATPDEEALLERLRREFDAEEVE